MVSANGEKLWGAPELLTGMEHKNPEAEPGHRATASRAMVTEMQICQKHRGVLRPKVPCSG